MGTSANFISAVQRDTNWAIILYCYIILYQLKSSIILYCSEEIKFTILLFQFPDAIQTKKKQGGTYEYFPACLIAINFTNWLWQFFTLFSHFTSWRECSLLYIGKTLILRTFLLVFVYTRNLLWIRTGVTHSDIKECRLCLSQKRRTWTSNLASCDLFDSTLTIYFLQYWFNLGIVTEYIEEPRFQFS